jgi:putative iron-only hydrogenase system regulator
LIIFLRSFIIKENSVPEEKGFGLMPRDGPTAVWIFLAPLCGSSLCAAGAGLYYYLMEGIMDIRLGFIGIVIDDPDHAAEINHILSRHGQIIAGRMGLPRLHHREGGVSVITLIVQGTTDEIGALTGQLGNIAGVQVRSALSNK